MIRSGTALLKDSTGAHKAFQDFERLVTAIGAYNLGTAGAGDESVALRLDNYAVDASFVEVNSPRRVVPFSQEKLDRVGGSLAGAASDLSATSIAQRATIND